MPRYSRSLCLLALILAAIAARPSAADKRPITEKDLFKFVWVADPQITPDGSLVAFVRVAIDEKKDQYETSLWLVKSDGSEPARPLTSGIRDTSPRWSPDGRQLAFTRSVEKDGRLQPPQIFVMGLSGGEPRPVTDIPRGAANPAWSPDGRLLAFSSGAQPEDLEKAKTPDAAAAGKPADKPRASDVKVITEAVYRANGIAGSGFVDRDHPSQIWTVAVPEGTAGLSAPKRITSGEFAATNHRWSPDGSQLYFVSDRRKESYYYPNDSDLFAVAKDGGDPKTLVSIDGTIGAFTPSPDGKRMAFVGTLHGTPERSYSQPDLWVVDLPGGTPRNLTASYDFDINGGRGGDQRAPRGQHPGGPVWSKDGRTILIRIGEQGNANLARADVASGRIDLLTKGSQEVMSYTADDS